MLHLDIPTPIKCRVNTKVFYDMGSPPPGEEEFTDCVLFAVSSYKDFRPTFKVFVEKTGGLFDYVPVEFVFSRKGTISPKISTKGISPKTCPSMDAVVTEHNFLKKLGKAKCYFPSDNAWAEGVYHCTIDWPNDNDNTNLMELETGQFALVPNHKLVWSSETKLPPYKKLRQEWK